MHVYYINLDHRTDRRRKIEKNLDKLPVTYSRVSAVFLDMDQLFNEDGLHHHYISRLSTKRFLTHERYKPRVRGIIGCFLSHLKTYELALTEQSENYLILEDDVSIISLSDLNKQINFLKTKEWDIYRSVWGCQRIEGTVARRLREPTRITTNHKLSKAANKYNQTNEYYGGSHFTYVNHQSTSKIVNFLNNENIFALDGVLCTSQINVFASNLRSVRVALPGSKDIPKTQ